MVTVIRFSQIVEPPERALRQRRDAAPQLSVGAPMADYALPHHLAAGLAARAGLGGDLRPGALAAVVARGRGGRGAAAPATRAASARVSRMVWKSLLPYRVEFEVTTTRVERPHLLEADAVGELSGIGRWRLYEQDGVTAVLYEWNVATTQGLDEPAGAARRARSSSGTTTG